MPRTAFLKVGSLLPALALRAVPQASLLSGLPGDAPFFQPPFFPRASQRAALSRERRDGRDLQRPDVDRRRYERRDRCGGSVAAHRRALRGARAEEAAEGAAEGGRRWRWVAGATVALHCAQEINSVDESGQGIKVAVAKPSPSEVPTVGSSVFRRSVG